eukprot:NODE_164_length_14719_cov_1.036252.p6 type:complete len:369 gc:universal NODE_164_length_14719_cov_1.036252:1686-580(-)
MSEENKLELDLFGVDDSQEKELFGSDVEMEEANNKNSLADEIFGNDVVAKNEEVKDDPIIEDEVLMIPKKAKVKDAEKPTPVEKEIPLDIPLDNTPVSSEESDIEDMHITFPSYPYPLVNNGKGFQIKLANGLTVLPSGYTGDDSEETERTALGGIRWRYEESNQKTTMISNSKLIEWEDGTYSMAVGEELFDLTEVSDKQKMFMSVKHEDMFNFLYNIERKFYMAPQKFTSKLSTYLRQQRKKKAQNTSEAKEILINEDPEKAALEAERIELEKEKLQRKLEKKQERKGLSNGYEIEEFQADYSEDEEMDDYDEEDDFVVADDQKLDELEEFEKELEAGADVEEDAESEKDDKPKHQSNIVFSSDED